jgi:hypothetical protein
MILMDVSLAADAILDGIPVAQSPVIPSPALGERTAPKPSEALSIGSTG